MPWLVGTAFLHSIVMQRKRGMLKIWSMALIILAFSLCIFGTFLTRSGVLSSVHSYDESHLGPYFLAFLGITLVGSFGLLLYRRGNLKSSSEITSLVSRESSFLLNNIILGVATIGIFIATLYPLLTEAVNGHKTTLQESFFDKTIAPVFLAAVFLAGICISLGWQRTSSKTMFRNYLLPLILALITSLVLFLIGLREWYALTLFPICAFVSSSHLFSWSREVRERCRLKKQNPLGAFWSLLWANKPRYAGMIVHLGMVLITIGVIGSSFYDVEKDATLAKGEAIELRGYRIVYDDLSYTTPSDTKMIVTARLSIFRGDKQVGVLKPKKEYSGGYQHQWTTEVGIRSTATEDLYVILSDWDEESGTATFKVLNNPLVIWMWIGGGFLLVGGVIAFWPDRRKGDLKESGRKG
jgi:cytochrome c-type biogenesis protein CcmF